MKPPEERAIEMISTKVNVVGATSRGDQSPEDLPPRQRQNYRIKSEILDLAFKVFYFAHHDYLHDLVIRSFIIYLCRFMVIQKIPNVMDF